MEVGDKGPYNRRSVAESHVKGADTDSFFVRVKHFFVCKVVRKRIKNHDPSDRESWFFFFRRNFLFLSS